MSKSIYPPKKQGQCITQVQNYGAAVCQSAALWWQLLPMNEIDERIFIAANDAFGVGQQTNYRANLGGFFIFEGVFL